MSLYDNLSDLPEDRSNRLNEEEIKIIRNKYEAYGILDVDDNADYTNHNQADRVLLAIKKIEAELMVIKDQMNKSIEFYSQEIDKISQTRSYMEKILNSFITYSGQKTMKLPNGTIRIRKNKKFIYPDDKTSLVEFCKANDIKTIINEKPDLKVLKKYITETGEIPSGVEIEEKESFSYKVGG